MKNIVKRDQIHRKDCKKDQVVHINLSAGIAAVMPKPTAVSVCTGELYGAEGCHRDPILPLQRDSAAQSR